MGNAPLMGLVLLPPWTSARGAETTLEAELRRELPPGHPLFGRTVRVLARRGDNDDVLFEAPELPRPYAVVHLTWKREQDPPWPMTVLYASLEQWAEERMKADHREYVTGEPAD